MAANRNHLWAAVTIPPLFWAAQGLFGWFVASHACPGTSRPWSLGAARVAVIIATVAALAVSVWGLTLAFRRMREQEKAQDVERVRYLSMMGLVVGAALTLGLVFAGLPALIIHSCGEMR